MAAAGTAAAFLLAAAPAPAAPGDLDLTFGGDGRVTTNLGGTHFDVVTALAIQQDGRIVAAGASGDSFEVARYNPDGTLDTSFSGDGIQVTTFPDGNSRGEGVAIQDDGKIVVAGSIVRSEFPYNDFAVARYNANGTLDTSFSGDGMLTAGLTGGPDDAPTSESGFAIAVQEDDKIVVGGDSTVVPAGHFTVARFEPDGDPDTTFSGDGFQTIDFGGDRDAIHALAIQPDDDKIVAAGSVVETSGDIDFALARFEPDGDPDSSFSGDGMQTTEFPSDLNAFESVAALLVQPDGRIVAAGNGNHDFALARYEGDGDLDPSFSGDGKVLTGGFSDSAFDTLGDAALQADGKIVAAGSSGAMFAVARFNPDGTLDPEFSGDGRQTTAFEDQAEASAVAIQPDGRIVAGGKVRIRSVPDGYDFALARYQWEPDITPPDTSVDSGPGGTTDDATPTFAFSANEPGSTFECRVDSAAFAPCTSPHTTGVLGAGAHTFEVRAIDPDGNTDSSPAASGFTLAPTPPQTTIDTGPSGTVNTSQPTFTFSTGESDSTYECSLDGGAFAVCASPYTTQPLVEGSHTFAVRATDPQDNTDPTPATRTFTTDYTPPETTIDSGPDGQTDDATPTFAFSTGDPGAVFQCSVDGAVYASCASPYTTAALANGPHSFEVRAVDTAGNFDSSPAARFFNVQPGSSGTGPAADSDGDGLTDPMDACPTVPAAPPTGCPTTAPPPGGGFVPGPGSGPPPGDAFPPSGPVDRTGPVVVVPGANRSITLARNGTLVFPVGPMRENTTGQLTIKTDGSVRIGRGRPRPLTLGTRGFQALQGQKVAVRIRLAANVRRLVAQKGRLRTKVTITLRDAAGNATIRVFRCTIRAPKRGRG